MTALKDLVLNLKGEYFDAIREGSKKEEYREATAYWYSRLHDRGSERAFRKIILLRGYPKGGGVEGEARLTRKWKGWEEKHLTHPHFGPREVLVYAIDVSEPAA